MKICIVLLSLACFAVAAPPYLKRGGFKQGGKYVYNYRAALKVKLSEPADQYTKIYMNSTLELHFLKNNQVVLRITKFNISEGVRDSNVGKIKTDSPLGEVMKEPLLLPMKFEYSSGVVGRLFAKKDDPKWSVNMKKGIVNLLHVDVLGKDEELQTNFLFRKPEISVFGICNTTYQMVDYVAATKTGRRAKLGMNITKVIDTDNCTMQKSQIMNNFLDSPLGEKEKRPMDSSAIVEYNIIGNELKFKIESVNATGILAVYPFSRKDTSVVALTYQRLRLQSESGTMIEDRNPEWLENLVPVGRLTIGVSPIDEPDFLWKWDNKDWENHVEFIHRGIETMARDYAPDWEPAAAMKNLTAKEADDVMQLVNALRICREKHLQRTWNKCNGKTRKWLVYLLSVCHTEDSVKFMTEKIEMTDMPKETIVEYLMSESFTGHPTKDQVTKFFKLCRKDKIARDPQLKTACYVSTSNLVKALCRREGICKTPFVEHIFQLLKKLQGCKSEKNKCRSIEKIPVMVLLSIAENIALPTTKPEAFFTLENIIEREDLPMEVRVKALLACRPLIRSIPRRVRVMLLKIFHNIDLDTEFRMMAFRVLMENPTPAIVEICARHTSMEPSLNVRKYVFQFLYGIAMEKPMKYEREIILACKRSIAMKMMWKPLYRHVPLDIPRHHEKRFYWKTAKFGGHWTFDSIVTNSSFVPRYIESKLNLTVLGRTIPLIDGEIRMEGVQEYLNKLFGVGGMWNKKSVFDFIRKPRSLFDEEEDNDSVDQTVPRSDEELKLFTQVKLFDKLLFINYTSLASNVDLKNLFLRGAIFRAAQLEEELKKGKSFSWFKPMFGTDLRYKLPTMVGLSLHCNVSSMAIPRVKTTIKANVKPNLFSISAWFKREHAEIEFVHNVSAVTRMTAGVFFSLPVYEVGVRTRTAVNVSTMISGMFKVDLKTMKKTLKMEMPKRTRDVMTSARESYFFIKPYPTRDVKVPTNLTTMRIEPEHIGELFIFNVTQPSKDKFFEEWILKTEESKYLTIKKNKIVIGEKPTIFRVTFHGQNRKHISLFVPEVGHITLSRTSDMLFVNPDMDKKGKVFEIEYKNLTCISLKTWAVVENERVGKEWPILSTEMQRVHRDDYDSKKRLWSSYHQEHLLEGDKIGQPKEHIRIVHLAARGESVVLSANEERKMLFKIDRNQTYYDRLMQMTRERGLCYEIGVFKVALCIHGFVTVPERNSVFRYHIAPHLMHLRVVPLKTVPDYLIFEKEIASVERKHGKLAFVKTIAKGMTEKNRILKTRGTIEVIYDRRSSIKFRVDFSSENGEKICFEREILPNNYTVWLSFDPECKVKNLKAHLTGMRLENHRVAKTAAAKLYYTMEKMPFEWKMIVGAGLRYMETLLNYGSSKIRLHPNKKNDGSGSVEFKLITNKTIEVEISTPVKTFVLPQIELPTYFDCLPRGSNSIPWFMKMTRLFQRSCKQKGEEFKTLDNKLYHYKLRGECEHVLMRNCSENMTNFVVLVSKLPDQKELRDLRVIVEDTEIFVAPEETGKKPSVEIDGKELDFEEKYEKYVKNRPVYSIIWEPKLKNLVVFHYKIGLSIVLHNNREIETRISPWYFNKVCGLCGNYDGEQMNEFVTPENHVIKDPTLFGSSWILPGKKCGDQCSKERYHVEESHQQRLCKTKMPIPRCVEGCRPDKKEMVLVPTYCVPDTTSHRMLIQDKILYGKKVEIQGLETMMREMEVPVECKCSCKN